MEKSKAKSEANSAQSRCAETQKDEKCVADVKTGLEMARARQGHVRSLAHRYENGIQKIRDDADRQKQRQAASDFFQLSRMRNERFQGWVEPGLYEKGMKEYREENEKRQREEWVEGRRKKLRQLLQDEERQYGLEICQKFKSEKKEEVRSKILTEINTNIPRKTPGTNILPGLENENTWARNLQAVKIKKQEERIYEEEKKMLMQKAMKMEKQEIDRNIKTQSEISENIQNCENQIEMKSREITEEERYLENLRMMKMKVDELLHERSEVMNQRRHFEEELEKTRSALSKLRRESLAREEDINEDRIFLMKMKSELVSVIPDELMKEKIQDERNQMLRYLENLERSEKVRKEHVMTIYDSESGQIWERLRKVWMEEKQQVEECLSQILSPLQCYLVDQMNGAETRRLICVRQLSEYRLLIDQYRRQILLLIRQAEERKRRLMKQIERKIEDEHLVRRRMREEQQKEEQKKEQKEEEERRMREMTRAKKDEKETQMDGMIRQERRRRHMEGSARTWFR